jgi:GntR family transcriptional regulator, transcriptional repressor for pyruvate dehydrogenase complex
MKKPASAPRNGQQLDAAIRGHFLEKGYKPGTRIETEHELAAHFGVSRYKIRYVLNSLVQQGILAKTPRRGTFIRHFDEKMLADNLQFTYRISRLSLDGYIEARIVAELAVLPLVVRRATPTQIAQMEETIDRMLRNKDVPEDADKDDLEFHLLLLRACGNELLASFTTVLSRLFHDPEYRRKYWKPETITRLAHEHRQILDAIKLGDVDLAVERHKSHLHYKEKVEKHGPG